MAVDRDELTVLQCFEPNTAACKTWRADNGAWSSDDYNCGTWMLPHVIEAGSLDDLAEAVMVVADFDAVIVRGGLRPWARALIGTHKPVARRQNDAAWTSASLDDVARRWVMLDIDGKYAMEPGDDLTQNPEPVIRRAVAALLPPCFQGVRCLWQLSNSVGFKPGFRAHLWYWLVHPVTNQDLRKLVLGGVMPAADFKMFNAVQPHYVAKPKVVNGNDPVPRRFGWLHGREDQVTLPPIPTIDLAAIPEVPRPPMPHRPPGASPRVFDGYAWLTLLGDGQRPDGTILRGFHDPILATTALYANHLAAGLVDRDDDAVIDRISAAVLDAVDADRDVSAYLAPGELARRIKSSVDHERQKTRTPPSLGRFGTPYRQARTTR